MGAYHINRSDRESLHDHRACGEINAELPCGLLSLLGLLMNISQRKTQQTKENKQLFKIFQKRQIHQINKLKVRKNPKDKQQLVLPTFKPAEIKPLIVNCLGNFTYYSPNK